jgi:hypothetical protein
MQAAVSTRQSPAQALPPQPDAAPSPRPMVEIVVGFEPGRDHLPIARGSRVSIHQDAGNVVIDRGKDGLVILQGLTLVDLVAGLEPVGSA